MIIIYSLNNKIPNGYLLCDGSEISRSTYNKLFNIIGITYGEGDNSTTFNLPDLTDRFIEGGNIAGIEKEAGLPNINGMLYEDGNGGFSTGNQSSKVKTGCFSDTTVGGYAHNGSISYFQNAIKKISFDASLSNSIYGVSDTVQPSTLTMKYIIKAY